MVPDIEILLDAVRERWRNLAGASTRQESFLLHLQTLGKQVTSEPHDSDEYTFPSSLSVAFAVCECGIKEFIVDGSTQECQNCGGLMFRTKIAKYELVL